MVDIPVGLSREQLAAASVFVFLLAGVAIRSLAGAISRALSRRSAQRALGGG
jgi:hypothetical protein